MLPLRVYEKKDTRTVEEVSDHPVAKLFKQGPNEYSDGMQFKEAMIDACLDYGNSYAKIDATRAGVPQRMVFLDPALTKPELDETGRLSFKTYLNNGQETRYKSEEILHFTINSRDGIIGRSPMVTAADAFNFSKSVSDHGLKYFENGTFIDFVLETEHFFEKDEQRKNFLKRFHEWYSEMGHDTVLLEQGVKLKPINTTNREAQFIESVDLSAYQIAQIYRVPPVFVQMMDKGMTFASVEQLAIFFVQYTIQPWATRLEHAINRQLLERFGEISTFARFNVNALLRGDMQAQTQTLCMRVQSGLLSINEARQLDDRNPIEGGDVYLIPTNNLSPVTELGEEQEEEPLESDEEETKEEGTKSAEKKAATFQRIIADTFERCTNKELKALGSAAKREGLMKWVEEFYVKHTQFMKKAFLPIAESLGHGEQEALKVADYYVSKRAFDISQAVAAGDSSCVTNPLSSTEADQYINEIVRILDGE
jgi:HK97 family phage portal protein